MAEIPFARLDELTSTWEDIEDALAAAQAAQAAAELAETNAETAETNAETAETNAEAAEVAAEAAAAEAAVSAAKLQGTSVTSLAIGTGSKAFVTQADKFFEEGTWVAALDAANPDTNYMIGLSSTYVGTALTIIVPTDGSATAGSGTIANWILRVAGAPGIDGLQGDPGEVTSTGTSVAGNVAVFTDASGDDIEDGGVAVDDIVTAASVDTFTNKTFDANGSGNSISNIETADIASGSKTGADADLVTGTAGTSGNLGMWNADGDMVDAGVAPAAFLLDTDIGTSVQAFDADTLKADVADTLTAGFKGTSVNLGSITGNNQTVTVNVDNGNFHHATFNGSSLTGTITIAVPGGPTTAILEVTNGGSGAVGGTLTTSAWDEVDGATYATTNAKVYMFIMTVTNSKSHLNIVEIA
jgi:hypothetical protein